MKKMMILLPLLLLSAQQCHSMSKKEKQSRDIVDQVVEAITINQNIMQAHKIMAQNKGNFDINGRGYYQDMTILTATLDKVNHGDTGFLQRCAGFIHELIKLGAMPTASDIASITQDTFSENAQVKKTATKVLDMLMKARS